jgi:hypothetical protein
MILADIVDSLPPTVVNLELDMDYDRKPYGPRLCDSLARIFPRLVHVRLALACLCSDVLVTVREANRVPALKTATIAFYDWWADVNDKSWYCCNGRNLKGARDNLFRNWGILIQSGVFPEALMVNLIQFHLHLQPLDSRHQNMDGNQRGPSFLNIQRFSRAVPGLAMTRVDFKMHKDCYFLGSKFNDGVYDSANVAAQNRNRGILDSDEIIGLAEGAAAWEGDHLCGRLPPSSFC